MKTKHRYEIFYNLGKEMFIRFVRKGRELSEFKERKDRYMFIRAYMDVFGIECAVKLVFNPIIDSANSRSALKVNKDLLWLAWGHKSKLIENVGIGDYTWSKE